MSTSFKIERTEFLKIWLFALSLVPHIALAQTSGGSTDGGTDGGTGGGTDDGGDTGGSTTGGSTTTTFNDLRMCAPPTSLQQNVLRANVSPCSPRVRVEMFGIDFRNTVGNLARHTIPRGAVSSVCTRIDANGANVGVGQLNCVTVVPRGVIYVDQANERVCLTNQELDSGLSYAPRSSGSSELVTTPYNGTVMTIKRPSSGPLQIELKDYGAREIVNYQVWSDPGNAADCKYLRRSTDYYDAHSNKLASAKFDVAYYANGDYMSHDTGLTRGAVSLFPDEPNETPRSWGVGDPALGLVFGGSVTATVPVPGAAGMMIRRAGFRSNFNSYTFEHIERLFPNGSLKAYLTWSREDSVANPAGQAGPGFRLTYYSDGTSDAPEDNGTPTWEVMPIVVPRATEPNSALNSTNFPFVGSNVLYLRSNANTVTTYRFGGKEKTVYSNWGAFGPTVVTNYDNNQVVGTLTTTFDALGRVTATVGTGTLNGSSSNTFDAQTSLLTLASSTERTNTTTTAITSTIGTAPVLPEVVVQKLNDLTVATSTYTYDLSKEFPITTSATTARGPTTTQTVNSGVGTTLTSTTSVTGQIVTTDEVWDGYGKVTSRTDADGLFSTTSTSTGYGSTQSSTTVRLSGQIVDQGSSTTVLNSTTSPLTTTQQEVGSATTVTQAYNNPPATGDDGQFLVTTATGNFGTQVTTVRQVQVSANPYSAFRSESTMVYTPPGGAAITTTNFCQSAPNGSNQCAETSGSTGLTETMTNTR